MVSEPRPTACRGVPPEGAFHIAAGALLGFVLEEIGPLVYNQAVAQVQERLLERAQELDIECHEHEFQFWRRSSAATAKPMKSRR